MTLRDDYVTKLEDENEELRERIRMLEAMMGFTFDAPLQFGMTAKESKIFGVLLKRDLATKQHIMDVLYSTMPDKEPDMKIVDVFVCKMRAKIKPFGVEVSTSWGRGWYMTAENKAKARLLLEQMRPATEAA